MPRRSPSPSSPTLAAKRMGRSGDEVGVAQGSGESQQAGQAGGVVAGAGRQDASFDLGGLGGSVGGEDGVEVSGEKDVRSGCRCGCAGG